MSNYYDHLFEEHVDDNSIRQRYNRRIKLSKHFADVQHTK